MGFFNGFSRRLRADSQAFEKRDSTADFCIPKGRDFQVSAPADSWPGRPKFTASGAPRDPAGIDVEDLTGRADVGEGQGIRAGHPNLGAEFCQFNEQGIAP